MNKYINLKFEIINQLNYIKYFLFFFINHKISYILIKIQDYK